MGDHVRLKINRKLVFFSHKTKRDGSVLVRTLCFILFLLFTRRFCFSSKIVLFLLWNVRLAIKKKREKETKKMSFFSFLFVFTRVRHLQNKIGKEKKSFFCLEKKMENTENFFFF